jgi:uncharacterized damage-inducible protein DinB
MDSLAHHFKTMAYNNAWANHRLLAAVERLSHEDFVAARTSFFPSIKGTLNHIVTVDWFYVDAIERAQRGEGINEEARKFFDPEEPFDVASELRAAQVAVDRRLIAICSRLDQAALSLSVGVNWSTGKAHEKLSRLLAHLFEHQIHHRGQAHAMLAGTPVKPPQLDEFFCANDAHLRAGDFAELGFSEEMIWK